MTDTVKTWKERKGLMNSEPFRAFIGVEWEMQAEIDELRAALAQQAEQVPREENCSNCTFHYKDYDDKPCSNCDRGINVADNWMPMSTVQILLAAAPKGVV